MKKPRLSLSAENEAQARRTIEKREAESAAVTINAAGGRLEDQAENNTQFQPIQDILDLAGAYDSHSSFVPAEPPKVSQPKITEVYWCQFNDAIYPEFGKQRPVLVILQRKKERHCTVLPITSREPDEDDQSAFQLKTNPNVNRASQPSWVITSHLYTISHHRLLRFHNKSTGVLYNPKIPADEFNEIIRLVYAHLPNIRES